MDRNFSDTETYWHGTQYDDRGLILILISMKDLLAITRVAIRDYKTNISDLKPDINIYFRKKDNYDKKSKFPYDDRINFEKSFIFRDKAKSL